MLAGNQDDRGGAGVVQVHGEAGAGGVGGEGGGGEGKKVEREWGLDLKSLLGQIAAARLPPLFDANLNLHSYTIIAQKILVKNILIYYLQLS